MEIQTLLPKITNNFLEDYLKSCGVDDVETYLNADLNCVDNPLQYIDMNKAIKRLQNAIKRKEKIGILIDSDADGILSSALLYSFFKEYLDVKNIVIYNHIGKQHGLVQNEQEDIIMQVVQSDINLLFCPDSASNDVNQVNLLKEYGIDVIILDHHEIEKLNSNAIVINHHRSENLNTALSGCGVTFKFVQAYCQQMNIDIKNQYYDMVAISLVTDMCNMASLENHALFQYGINNITNPMIKAMINSYSFGNISPYNIAWTVSPKINSVFRAGTLEDKNNFFYCFVGEKPISQGLEICEFCHKNQRKVVNTLTKELNSNLEKYDNVIIGFAFNEETVYNGLIANKIAGTNHKTTLVIRETQDKYMGSLRSPIDIANKINDTGLALCQGHLQACGIELEKNKLNDLVEWFNHQTFSIKKNVSAIIEAKQITQSLCQIIENNKDLWNSSEAAKITKPKFYITFSNDSYNIYTNRTTTIKFNVNGTNIIKFRAKKEDVELIEKEDCKIEAIITLSINEWNGNKYPQAIIEEWEIVPTTKNSTLYDNNNWACNW